MINKVLKSEKEAAKVAKELVKDLNERLNLYQSYKVKMEPCSSQYEVSVTSPEGSCHILTDSCIEAVTEILAAYKVMYSDVNYHIGTDQILGGNIPSFIICIGYREEK